MSHDDSEMCQRFQNSVGLMDYIYIPLGGNRKGRRRQRANLMATMLIGGLWHGASWMYLLWGGYNGALLVGHKALKRVWHVPAKLKENIVSGSIIRATNILITFILITIGFAFFRAESVGHIGDMATAIFTNFHAEIAPQFVAGYALIVVAIAAGFLLHFAPHSWQRGLQRAYGWLPLAVQALILAAVLFLVIQTRQSSLVPFIYLQY